MEHISARLLYTAVALAFLIGLVLVFNHIDIFNTLKTFVYNGLGSARLPLMIGGCW